jgi:hypothetical protein
LRILEYIVGIPPRSDNPMKCTLLNAAMFCALSVACAGTSTTVDENFDEEEAALTAFRSNLDDRGALPFVARKIHYPEDPRPFEGADVSLAQTAGRSKYVSHSFRAKKGDGLLISAHKQTDSTGAGDCEEIVRMWLLDSQNRVVKTGTKKCYSEYEEPGLRSQSDALRYYVESDDTYKIVVTVLASPSAHANADIRKSPWKWTSLDVIRSTKANQGAPNSRCEGGTDILCQSSLRCERARCK